jgi:hypothetical protein
MSYQEQARRAFAARVLKRDKINVKTSVALEAKALGGYGVEFAAALLGVTAKLRTIVKLSGKYITALEHYFSSYGPPRGALMCAPALRLRSPSWQPRVWQSSWRVWERIL